MIAWLGTITALVLSGVSLGLELHTRRIVNEVIRRLDQ